MDPLVFDNLNERLDEIVFKKGTHFFLSAAYK